MKKTIFSLAMMIFIVANYAKADMIEVDPLTPLTNYRSLGEWNTNDNFEGWYENMVDNYTVSGGNISGTVNGNDPWIRKDFVVSEYVNVKSGAVIEIKCKYDADASITNTTGRFYFNDGSYHMIYYAMGSDMQVDGQFHVYRVTLSQDYGNSSLCRIDPYQAGMDGKTFEIDYVRIAGADPEPVHFKVDPEQPLANYVTLAEWNTDGDFEAWVFENIGSSNVTGGVMSGSPTSDDPYFYKDIAAGLPSVNLTNATIVEFRIKQSSIYTSDMQIFFGTSSNPGMSGSRSAIIPKSVVPVDGNFHIYQYDMSSRDNWDSLLQTLRIDPYVAAGAIGQTFEIDYIRVGSYEAPIANPTASYGTYSDKVVINWDEVFYDTKYQLWRNTTNNSSTATSIASDITTNYFDDTTVSQDIYYYYWLKVWGTNSWGDFGDSDVGFATASTGPDKPTNILPVDGTLITSFPVFLKASTYSDEYSWPMIAAQWQIDNDTNFSYTIWDSGTISTTLTAIEPPSSVFKTQNFWRVRYKNNHEKWSEWSSTTMFNFNYNRDTNAEYFFCDSFNVTDNGDVNKDYWLAGRQFGSDAPINYTIVADTEIGMDSSNPGQLTLGLNSGCSINKSFTDSGSFKIEFDVIPHNLDQTTDWVALSFGKSDQSSLFPVSPSGAGLVFFCNQGFQAYDGDSKIGSGWGVANDKKLHIILTADTYDFDYSQSQFSAFVNGVPMLVDSAKSGYVYNDSNGYGENYIALYNYNASSTNKSIFDNLKISKVENSVSVTNWLSDSDMPPMNPAKTTHAVNLNGESVTINGVDFIGTGTNFGDYANGSAILKSNGWELMSSGGIVTFHSGQAVTNLVSDIGTKTLMEYFTYFDKAAGIKLSDLNPFSSNVISVYSYGWEDQGLGRFAYFSSTSGGTILNIDQDTFGKGSGIIIRYGYVADKNGEFTLVVSPDGSSSFHISGFSSEEIHAPSATINVANKLDFGEVGVGIPTTLQLEIMNTGGGIVSGYVSDISAPFTMIDSYLATAATSDIINVTFNPSSEEVYSQTITLSGSGGNVQVILTGTGVPEPCLFIICYLSFIIYYFKRK